MLCKMTSKNQITLPRELVKSLGDQIYFDAKREGSRIVLDPVVVRPVETGKLVAIRDKMQRLEISKEDIDSIVTEVRHDYGS